MSAILKIEGSAQIRLRDWVRYESGIGDSLVPEESPDGNLAWNDSYRARNLSRTL